MLPDSTRSHLLTALCPLSVHSKIPGPWIDIILCHAGPLFFSVYQLPCIRSWSASVIVIPPWYPHPLKCDAQLLTSDFLNSSSGSMYKIALSNINAYMSVISSSTVGAWSISASSEKDICPDRNCINIRWLYIATPIIVSTTCWAIISASILKSRSDKI